MRNRIGVVGLFLMFAACSAEHEVQVGFYNWKTQLETNDATLEYLDRLQCKTLYVKFFDVDIKDNKPFPTAILTWESESWKGFQIVPTVFITNRTLQQIEPSELLGLAQNIHQKITDIAAAHPIEEIQIDCDWTASTQQKYFELLRQLKVLFPQQQLSATIRLHQIKFKEQTGIPPIDKGALMCYNTGKIEDWATENSILSVTTAKQYLDRLSSYPIPLDIALPLFHWGLIYRDQQLFRIVNALDSTDLADSERFEQLSDHRYKVIKNTYLKGHYLYEADLIRLEAITAELLQEMANVLQTQLKLSDRTILFYHLEASLLHKFPSSLLNDIKHTF